MVVMGVVVVDDDSGDDADPSSAVPGDPDDAAPSDLGEWLSTSLYDSRGDILQLIPLLLLPSSAAAADDDESADRPMSTRSCIIPFPFAQLSPRLGRRPLLLLL